MGKKIKKAVKKVVKKVVKPVKKAVKQVGGAVGGVVKAPKAPEAPEIPDPIPPAVVVAAPTEDVETDTGRDTESGKRKTQSRGKNKLTVARSSGRGLNI